MSFVDLSAFVESSSEATLPFLRTEIAYHSHAAGAAQAKQLLQVPPSLFRNEEGWATETITRLGTHDTTHVDAPWHYNSVIQGERAQTIDELPLEWFFNDGVVLDMTHKAEGDPMTVADAEAALDRMGYALKPLDIVLVRTGSDRFYDQPDYIFRGCGVTAEATHWLFDRRVRVMGIDAWGWDMPLNRQALAALKSGQPGVFWAAHQVDLPYAQIERLVNLASLPATGFKVACFPLKVKGASAGPARVVALVP
ncbi:MAG: cyclase family protein [Anaerolineae bacterium]